MMNQHPDHLLLMTIILGIYYPTTSLIFAEKGNPNGENLPVWDKYSKLNPNILELKPEPANYEGFSIDKYKFWKNYIGKDFNIWN